LHGAGADGFSFIQHSKFNIARRSEVGTSEGTRAKIDDGIEERTGYALDTEVDGGEETVVHEDDIAAVSVGNDDLPHGIEKCDVPIDDKAKPTGFEEEPLDLRIGRGLACDGGLADQEAEALVGALNAKKDDFIAEDFIVEVPTLQIVDGRCLALLVGTVNDEQTKKVGPGGLEKTLCIGKVPDLMFIALLVRQATQVWRGGFNEEVPFRDVAEEDGEFLVEIGSTSLKTRNCFTAAA